MIYINTINSKFNIIYSSDYKQNSKIKTGVQGYSKPLAYSKIVNHRDWHNKHKN